MTVYWDDLGSSTVFLQSCPKIQSLDDSFRGVLLSPPASQSPGPDRDASWRNLLITDSQTTHSGWHPPRLLRCILKGDATQLPVWSYVISLEPHDVSFTAHCTHDVNTRGFTLWWAHPLKLLRPGFSWAGTPAQRVRHGWMCYFVRLDGKTHPHTLLHPSC